MANPPPSPPNLLEVPEMGAELVHRVLGTKVRFLGGIKAQDRIQILVDDGFKELWVELEDYKK